MGERLAASPCPAVPRLPDLAVGLMRHSGVKGKPQIFLCGLCFTQHLPPRQAVVRTPETEQIITRAASRQRKTKPPWRESVTRCNTLPEHACVRSCGAQSNSCVKPASAGRQQPLLSSVSLGSEIQPRVLKYQLCCGTSGYFSLQTKSCMPVSYASPRQTNFYKFNEVLESII